MSGRPKLEIEFPWEVEAGFQGPQQTITITTDLGKAYACHAPLEDGTLIAFMVDPLGNARFMRMRPETDWAIEESRKGKFPPAIRAKLDEVWKVLMDEFARANRECRELEGRAASTQQPGEGECP